MSLLNFAIKSWPGNLKSHQKYNASMVWKHNFLKLFTLALLSVDCKLSGWTSWSSCTKTCSGGIQMRNRSVLRLEQFGGEPCPKLEETNECNTKECPGKCNCQSNTWTTNVSLFQLTANWVDGPVGVPAIKPVAEELEWEQKMLRDRSKMGDKLVERFGRHMSAT